MSESELPAPEPSPVLAELAEAVAVPAKPPGPGFWAAIACCLIAMVAQIVVVTGALIVWLVIEAVLTHKPPDPGSLPATLMIGAATIGTLVGAMAIVAAV